MKSYLAGPLFSALTPVDPVPLPMLETLDLLPAKACATAAAMEGWREETTEEVTEATEGEEEEEKVFLLDPLDPEKD